MLKSQVPLQRQLMLKEPNDDEHTLNNEGAKILRLNTRHEIQCPTKSQARKPAMGVGLKSRTMKPGSHEVDTAAKDS